MAMQLRARVAPRRLTTRWVGGGRATDVLPQLRGAPAVVAVIGPRGPAGTSAIDETTTALAVEVAVAAGMPLAINRASSRFVMADASIYARSFVVGHAAEDCPAGFVVAARSAGAIELSDWTAIAGTTVLAPGRFYYLAPGGGITVDPPTAAGSSVTVIGEAVTSTRLDIRRSPPILR